MTINRDNLFQRVMTLMDVMKAMTSTLKLQDLLKRIVQAVTQALPCEACILWLFDEDQKNLHPVTLEGFDWEEVGDYRFRPGEGALGTAYQDQISVITNDLKTYPKYVKKGWASERVISLLDVPMILDGRSIGVLDATNKIPGHDFDEEDARILSMLATQAAIAIRNARIHEEVQRKAYELEVLHSISQVIGTSLNTKEVLRIIIEQTSKVMRFSDCSIFLFEPRVQELVLAAALGPRQSRAGQLRLSMEAPGLLTEVAKSMKSHIVSPAEIDKYRNDPPADYQGIQTAVAAAMYLPDKLIGVVEMRDASAREFSNEDLVLFQTITRQMAVFIEKANLYRTIQELYLDVIKSLSEAVEAKDPETIGHCFRVSEYATRVARMMNLPEDQVSQIRVAAHLHDIGKIGVSEAILFKPDHLTEEEYSKIKLHSKIGARILTPIELLGPISTIVKHHHERFDGTGYPEGLAGDQIPLGSRILAVADSFEAMTWDRPYNVCISHQQAFGELERCSGTQFDPKVVRAFRIVYEQLFPNR